MPVHDVHLLLDREREEMDVVKDFRVDDKSALELELRKFVKK